MVRSAITTDFILSAEIMVIALNELADEPFLSRALILILVAIAITVLVYGVVDLIVKMDDVGLYMAERKNPVSQRVGRALVKGMPYLLTGLSTVGIAAMLWVGGHILLVGFDELGWHWLYESVHRAEETVAHMFPALGGFLGWLTNTIASAFLGLVMGGIVVAVMHLIPKRRSSAH